MYSSLFRLRYRSRYRCWFDRFRWLILLYFFFGFLLFGFFYLGFDFLLCGHFWFILTCDFSNWRLFRSLDRHVVRLWSGTRNYLRLFLLLWLRLGLRRCDRTFRRFGING